MPAGEERLGGGGVVDGGDADGGCVEWAYLCEAGLDGCEAGYGELLRGVGGDGGVTVDDGDELDGFAGLFEFAVDTKVVAPEGSRSDDGDAEWL